MDYESNLKPAKEFYRNLMMEENMKKHGERVIKMIKDEGVYCNEELKKSLQEEFNYSDYVREYEGNIYGLYGDRGVENYKNRIYDLCLDKDVIEKINFLFIKNSCHMPMIENLRDLAEPLNKIFKDEN